jgi:hypothetical protein
MFYPIGWSLERSEKHTAIYDAFEQRKVTEFDLKRLPKATLRPPKTLQNETKMDTKWLFF